MSHTPDPRANGLSTVDYCALLPQRRYSHEARGRVLLLPSSGLVIVPFEQLAGGGWYAAVVDGHGSYPVGGYHLCISRMEVETAIELSLGEAVPTTVVATIDEAEAVAEGDYILTRDHGGLRKRIIDGETFWTRSILKKVSLRTAEITDQSPVVVRAGKVTANV